MTAETETETAATETAPVPSPVLPAADFPDQDQATVAAPEAAAGSPQDAADEIVRHCDVAALDFTKLEAETARVGYPVLPVVEPVPVLPLATPAPVLPVAAPAPVLPVAGVARPVSVVPPAVAAPSTSSLASTIP